MIEAAHRIEMERRRLNDLSDPNPNNPGRFPTKLLDEQQPRDADDISWAMAHARDIADMTDEEYQAYVKEQQGR